MLNHTHNYIAVCEREGILTSTPFRKYPLRNYYLGCVLKLYAVVNNLPYQLDTRQVHIYDDYTYYLTDKGLEWLYEEFSKLSLKFLRTYFRAVFSKATEEDIASPETFGGYNNFRGTSGVRPKKGTVGNRACVIRRVGRFNVERERLVFPNLKKARAYIKTMSQFYPVSEYSLYSIRVFKEGEKSYESLIPAKLFVREISDAERERLVSQGFKRKDT